MDDFPGVKAPYSSRFSLSSLSTMKDNKFNTRVEVNELDAFWDGEVELRNLAPDQRRTFNNFFVKQNGTAGEFYFRDHKHEQLGNWLGTPRVKGANQDGNALLVDGLQASLLIAPEGDRFQLGDYLYHLTSDVTTDVGGEVELRFEPDLRVIPADNTLLIVNNPACKCMLYPGQKGPEAKGKQRLADWSVKFRESIR